jgi:hypothetical protein
VKVTICFSSLRSIALHCTYTCFIVISSSSSLYSHHNDENETCTFCAFQDGEREQSLPSRRASARHIYISNFIIVPLNMLVLVSLTRLLMLAELKEEEEDGGMSSL